MFKLCDVHSTLILHQQAILTIQSIPHPIITIAASGPTLTGKSSFLNHILSQNVFPINHTTNPSTKGIWAYTKTIHINKQPICLLAIDSEGVDHIESSPENDIKLMLLLMSLQAHIFYLNHGALDSTTIKRIVSFKDKLGTTKPNLTLVQKDFNLELVDKLGHHLTAEDYLEMCLQGTSTKSQINSIYNEVGCVLMSSELSSQYKRLAKQILTYEETDTLTFINRLMVGVQCINQSGRLPPDFLERVQGRIKEQRQIEWRKRKQTIDKQINKIQKQIPIPQQLLRHHLNQLNSQLSPYKKQLISHRQQPYIEKITKQLEQKNDKEIESYIQRQIQSLLNAYHSQTYQQAITTVEQNIYSSGLVQKKYHHYVKFKVLQKMHTQLVKEQQNHNLVSQKDKVILEKDVKINLLNQQVEKIREKFTLMNQQHQHDIQEFHKLLQQSFKRETQLCSQISSKIKHLQEQPFPDLDSLLLQLKTTLTSNHQQVEDEIHQNKHKLQQIQQCLLQQGSSNIFQQQYQQLQTQYQKLNHDCQLKLEAKDEKIGELMRKLQKVYHHHDLYEQEIMVVRGALTDKGKGTQFMQKIIQDKDKMIDNMREQMIKRSQLFREELNKCKQQHNGEVAKLNEIVSMYTIYNQQLKNKNHKLSSALSSIEKKNKQIIQQITQKHSQQVDRLNNKSTQLERDLQRMSDSSKQVIHELQTIITHKESHLQQFHQQVTTLELSLHKAQTKLIQVEEQAQNSIQKVNQLEIEKEQIQANFKRQVLLVQNKKKHIEHQLQKMNTLMKQKESMFDVMLLQLRGQQLVERKMGDYQTKRSKSKNFNNILDRVEKHIKNELGRQKVRGNEENQRYPLTEKKERNTMNGFKTVKY